LSLVPHQKKVIVKIEYTKIVSYLGGLMSFSTWYMHKWQ